MSKKPMTYADTGVDYGAMDPFKRMALQAGRETAVHLQRFGDEFIEFEPSRGESAYLIERPDEFLAHVVEGLGTKDQAAELMTAFTGVEYFDSIGQDTAATILNDLVTLGAIPLSLLMHLAVGDSKWFEDERRQKALVAGWKKACDMARCTWGGGETPTLVGNVFTEPVVLSGTAMGFIRPKSRLIIGSKIRAGDQIILLTSSGIQTNGLTLGRKLARKLPQGLSTRLRDGRMYGEALLDPSKIYVRAVEDCLDAGVDIHGAIHITGHGWRKLMRANQPFTYVIETLPPSLPVFEAIQQYGPVTAEEAYGNLNMGAAFALYVSESDTDQVLRLCPDAFHGGYIENGPKKVRIKPVKTEEFPDGLEFSGSTLAVR